MQRERDDDDDDDGDEPQSPDLSRHRSPTFLAHIEPFVYDSSALKEEQLQSLIDKEINFGFKKDEDVVIVNWVRVGRLAAISWILEEIAAYGFRSRTAYLCMTYFDRFIFLRIINSSNGKALIRLLSLACLSLAAKMEEVEFDISLSHYEEEDYFFEAKDIEKMELVVLGVLDWKMNIITPFEFVNYCISKLCQESTSYVKSWIIGYVLSIMTGTILMHHRPSVIAAAATLMALNQKLTKEELEPKIKSIAGFEFLEIEGVFLCYSIMQEKELKLENPEEP